MTKIPRPILGLVHLLALIAFVTGLISAQTTYDRTFTKPPADVQRVVNDLREASRGRLPTLEGFVESPDQPLDQYQRGYYECTFQITPSGSGGSKVQATAKITAWFTDSAPTRSGYRVLVSNGHVENDLLDQIEAALGPSSAVAAKTPAPHTATSSGGLRPQIKTDPSGLSPGESSSNKNAADGAHTVPARQPADSISPPAAAPGESVESMRLRRANDEKLAQELTEQIKSLEEVLHNQVRPTDLVVVKKSATPVLSKPSDSSQTLLTADAQDEFQIIEVEGGWVHVQISGASRGWIRRSQLDLPADYGKAPPKTSAATAPTGAEAFSISKQETNTFGGNWEPLKGKPVKVLWIEPVSANAATTPRQKLDFAKALFLKTYAEVNSAAPVQGVIIVFDSADGGQIAATLSSLKQMAAGDLSEAAFWKQCSLDPPESFQDSPTP
ncbi:MAG: hypothetical protein WCA38_18885 [Candidatus Acidiferrales bacterium]